MSFEMKSPNDNENNFQSRSYDILYAIAPWNIRNKLLKALSSHHCMALQSIHGKGAQGPYHNYLDYIPTISPEKVVIFGLCRTQNVPAVYDCLNHSFSFDKRDTGVAFSSHVNAISKQNREKKSISIESTQKENNTHMKLLYVIVNDGFSGEFLDLLDKAGAKGATILSALGWSGLNPILGVSVDPAKEVIMTVVSDEVCAAVTEKIEQNTSLSESANGIAISLDVSSVNHINKFLPNES